VKTPRLWDYDVCGQWPGVVDQGATVHLRCADNLPPHRYVIVQLPRAAHLNFCELQVFVRRTYSLYYYYCDDQLDLHYCASASREMCLFFAASYSSINTRSQVHFA